MFGVIRLPAILVEPRSPVGRDGEREGVERDVDEYDGLDARLDVGLPELKCVEALIVQADFEGLGRLQKIFTRELLIKDGVPADRNGREQEVVALLQPSVVQEQAGEQVVPAKVEKRKREQEVLVEEVLDQIRVPAVALAAVDK